MILSPDSGSLLQQCVKGLFPVIFHKIYLPNFLTGMWKGLAWSLSTFYSCQLLKNSVYTSDWIFHINPQIIDASRAIKSILFVCSPFFLLKTIRHPNEHISCKLCVPNVAYNFQDCEDYHHHCDQPTKNSTRVGPLKQKST